MYESQSPHGFDGEIEQRAAEQLRLCWDAKAQGGSAEFAKGIVIGRAGQLNTLLIDSLVDLRDIIGALLASEDIDLSRADILYEVLVAVHPDEPQLPSITGTRTLRDLKKLPNYVGNLAWAIGVLMRLKFDYPETVFGDGKVKKSGRRTYVAEILGINPTFLYDSNDKGLPRMRAAYIDYFIQVLSTHEGRDRVESAARVKMDEIAVVEAPHASAGFVAPIPLPSGQSLVAASDERTASTMATSPVKTLPGRGDGSGEEVSVMLRGGGSGIASVKLDEATITETESANLLADPESPALVEAEEGAVEESKRSLMATRSLAGSFISIFVLVLLYRILNSLRLSTIVAGLGTVAVAAVCFLVLYRGGKRGPQPSTELTEDRLLERAQQLANQLAAEWRTQENRHLVSSELTLRVRWRSADTKLIDPLAFGSDQVEASRSTPDLGGEFSQILEVYEKVPSGRLVVIGETGSGKTQLVTRLAILIVESSRYQCAPFRLSATTWGKIPRGDDRTISSWLESELARRSPELGVSTMTGPSVAAKLLEGRLILPIIDGIDELEPLDREDLLEQLESGEALGMKLLLTSRADVLRGATQSEIRRIARAAAIEIEPLELAEIVAHFEILNKRYPSEGWADLRRGVQATEAAQQLAADLFSTPLMLFLARSVCRMRSRAGIRPVSLLSFTSAAEARDSLISGFIPAVFSDLRYKSQRLMNWFRFLARVSGGSEIAWWQIPNVIPWPLRAIPLLLLVGALGAVFAGALVEFSGAPSYVIPVTVVLSLSLGAALGAVDIPSKPVVSYISFREGWPKNYPFPSLGTSAGFVYWAVQGVISWDWLLLLIVGAVCGILPARVDVRRAIKHKIPDADSFSEAARATIPAGAVAGLIVGAVIDVTGFHGGSWWQLLFIGFAFDMIVGWAYLPLVSPRNSPVRGTSMREMTFSNMVATALFSFMFALGYSVVFYFMLGEVITAIAGGAAIGIAFGLATNIWGRWLIFGRIWLPVAGKLPPKFHAFIDQACERGVLYAVGPTYKFRHEEVRKHLLKSSE